MKKIILICTLVPAFLFCLNNKSYGQFSISFHYSSLNKIGLGYDFSPRFRTEVKIYSNTYVENITPELTFNYNVSVKDNHEIYVGIGGVINYFSGVVLPVGVQFRPFENFRRFSLQIEIEPTMDIENEDILIQASAGIRYMFGKKN